MTLFFIIATCLALGSAFLIARPLLTRADASPPDASSPPARSRVGRMAAFSALGAMPLAALLVYFWVGTPEALDPTRRAAVRAAPPPADPAAAIAALPEDERQRRIEAMVAGLAERLSNAPDDPEGWRMLARSWRVLGRLPDSAAAWREAIARSSPSADDLREYSLTLLDQRSAEGEVSAELEGALTRLRQLEADDPLALFILGHAARNRGDAAEALALWERLIEILPPEAPILPALNALIAETKN